jgi:hypothetical protein
MKEGLGFNFAPAGMFNDSDHLGPLSYTRFSVKELDETYSILTCIYHGHLRTILTYLGTNVPL